MERRGSTDDPGRTPGAGARPRISPVVLAGGLALAYLPVYLPTVLRPVGLSLSHWGPPAVIIWNWLAVGLLGLYVLRIERLPVASLRLTRPSEKDLEWAGYLGGVALLWHWLSARALPAGLDAQGLAAQETLVAPGPLVALLLVATVAFTEEFLWRGYVVERLGAWIGPIVAAVIGLAVFAASHLPFSGTGWLITGLPGAVLLYVLLLWRRNLWAVILCHLLMDAPIVVLALVA